MRRNGFWSGGWTVTSSSGASRRIALAGRCSRTDAPRGTGCSTSTMSCCTWASPWIRGRGSAATGTATSGRSRRNGGLGSRRPASSGSTPAPRPNPPSRSPSSPSTRATTRPRPGRRPPDGSATVGWRSASPAGPSGAGRGREGVEGVGRVHRRDLRPRGAVRAVVEPAPAVRPPDGGTRRGCARARSNAPGAHRVAVAGRGAGTPDASSSRSLRALPGAVPVRGGPLGRRTLRERPAIRSAVGPAGLAVNAMADRGAARRWAESVVRRPAGVGGPLPAGVGIAFPEAQSACSTA